MQVVSLMFHVLNAEENERCEKLVYCVPPEILPMLEEFRKKIVLIMSKENSLRAEAIKGALGMRLTRLGAALRSPYVQISTPDLPSK
ncbi:hypothetical protein PIB30_067092 [Stylosanthes scabra]|uniref:Uncharacterized protein n=1 Tax=Stylosanthes scabra TaxID=79078 RepID=A0ABU6XMK4_9FABA|nr:hypothetical protein [Stylosanthes scabra]